MKCLGAVGAAVGVEGIGDDVEGGQAADDAGLSFQGGGSVRGRALGFGVVGVRSRHKTVKSYNSSYEEQGTKYLGAVATT